MLKALQLELQLQTKNKTGNVVEILQKKQANKDKRKKCQSSHA